MKQILIKHEIKPQKQVVTAVSSEAHINVTKERSIFAKDKQLIILLFWETYISFWRSKIKAAWIKFVIYICNDFWGKEYV